jgi:uncharacterized protein YabE (DUF348 family)
VEPTQTGLSRLVRRLAGRRTVRRSRLRTIAAALALVAIVAIALAVAADRLQRRTVTLAVDGSARHLHTRAETVEAVVREAGVTVAAEDAIQPAPETRVTDGMTISVQRAHVVALLTGVGALPMRTQSIQPLDVLAEQDIAVGPYDVVEVDGQAYSRDDLTRMTWSAPAVTLRVLPSATLTVIDGEQPLVLHTTASDVGRALDAAGLTLYLADRLTPDLSAPVADGMAIHIERSVPVTVVADGQRLKTRALGPTVGDALAAIGLAPLGLDYTLPALETPLDADMTIQVVRVSESVESKDEAIPFVTLYRVDPALEPGAERVIQEGADGLRRWQIRVRYEDGREVSRAVVDEVVVRIATPRVIAYGRSADE